MSTRAQGGKTRYVAAFALALSLVPGAAWARGTLYPPGPPMPALPPKVVDQLVVNTTNVERTVIYGKCEAEGVREIFELLKTALVEEIWAHVPGAGPHECKWIEIGRDITTGPEGTTIRVDRPFLAQLMMEHDELHLYHFHPLAYFERCTNDTDCGPLSLPRRAGQIAAEGLVLNLRYAMPSPEDIYFMMDVSWELNRRRAGRGKILHRVITPYGLVEYALTGEGQERFDNDRNLRTGGLYIALVAGNTLLDDPISAFIERHPNDVAEALSQLAATLNTRYLRVSFRPFDNGP
jgi:hypothetical protein